MNSILTNFTEKHHWRWRNAHFSDPLEINKMLMRFSDFHPVMVKKCWYLPVWHHSTFFSCSVKKNSTLLRFSHFFQSGRIFLEFTLCLLHLSLSCLMRIVCKYQSCLFNIWGTWIPYKSSISNRQVFCTE